jgi:hypothetical protein
LRDRRLPQGFLVRRPHTSSWVVCRHSHRCWGSSRELSRAGPRLPCHVTALVPAHMAAIRRPCLPACAQGRGRGSPLLHGDVTSRDVRVSAALQRAESGAHGRWQQGQQTREVGPRGSRSATPSGPDMRTPHLGSLIKGPPRRPLQTASPHAMRLVTLGWGPGGDPPPHASAPAGPAPPAGPSRRHRGRGG